jgi:uncharacterized membrane protein YhaH (DUF805 family)
MSWSKFDKMITETVEETDKEYNKNPFLPQGKMKRSSYLIGIIIINLCLMTVAYIIALIGEKLGLSKNSVMFFFIPLGLSYIIFWLFIIKKRLYDITLKPVLSWILAIILPFFALCCCAISSSGASMFTLLNLILLFTPSKKKLKGIEGQTKNKNENKIFSKVKTSLISSKNYILDNKRNIIIILLSIALCFILFKITCYERRVVDGKIITINKITGKIVKKYTVTYNYKRGW